MASASVTSIEQSVYPSVSKIAPFDYQTNEPAKILMPPKGTPGNNPAQYATFNSAAYYVIPFQSSLSHPEMMPPVNAPITVRMPDYKANMPRRTYYELSDQTAKGVGMRLTSVENRGHETDRGSMVTGGVLIGGLLLLLLWKNYS